MKTPVLGSLLLLSASSLFGANPTNVLVILADDLGWSDLGCQGSDYYETPNIDRFAAAGTRFTSAYACPNCAPSRASLFTGMYPTRHGIYTVGTGNRGKAEHRKYNAVENVTTLPRSIPTIAELMEGSPYATGLYGKWHLGDQPASGPAMRGFSDAIWWLDQSSFPKRSYFGFDTEPAVAHDDKEYLTDFLTDQAIGFLRQSIRQRKPFVLFLTHFAVHGPREAPAPLVEKYRHKLATGRQGRDPVYAAMIEALDQNVGRLLQAVHFLGLDESTLIIFASDNGGLGGYDPELKFTDMPTTNAPLRGGKGQLYEGGIRVPMMAVWPGKIPMGRISDVPVALIDVLPTILAVTGQKPAQCDGLSLVDLMENKVSRLNRSALYWHFPGYLEGGSEEGPWRCVPSGALREGNWKLIQNDESDTAELYDLKQDISERHDLAAQRPEVVKTLKHDLAGWRRRTGAAMATPNPAYHPAN